MYNVKKILSFLFFYLLKNSEKNIKQHNWFQHW